MLALILYGYYIQVLDLKTISAYILNYSSESFIKNNNL